jgi:conjugal transfer pilus assembly protein TraD
MPFRPIYEARAAAAWFLAFAYFQYEVMFGNGPTALMMGLGLVCLVASAHRANQALKITTLRASLSGRAMEKMPASELRRFCKDPDQVWLGFGFDWKPEHAQRLYELSKSDYRQWVLPAWLARLLGVNVLAQPESEIGLPYIHGVEPKEGPLYRPLVNFEGGTCIAGTTQSGKGVMLSILIAQAIYRGDVVIIFDPKNSSRLKNNVIRACRDAGRDDPLEFHPAFPERGVRLDPMFNWQKPTELASRIQSIMPPDTTGAFAAFGWNAVNVVVQGLVEVEERPNLLKLAQYIEAGIEGVLQACLEKHFRTEAPANWRECIRPYMKAAQDTRKRPSDTASDLLMAYVAYYERELAPHRRNKVIDAQIAVFRHPREHYQKVTANLLPILSMLTSGTLGRSLAPDPFDVEDQRPIMNLEKVVNGGHVLYVALDSLPDPAVASAIGAIFLADLAALAGMRYNSGRRGPRISLFVDEVSNVINQPLIEILNKGAESGIYATCAMQTFADLARRLGSDDAARMALGNMNTLIALRSKDRPTQEYITETFGKTYISDVVESFITGQNQQVFDFSGAYSRRLGRTREEIVPSDVLGKLPNLQYFGSVAGGRIVKGRIPIIDPGQVV